MDEFHPIDSWKGVKLHAVVVAIIALSYPIMKNPSATLILGGFLCLPAYVALGFMEAIQAPLFFTPLSFYFFWYSIALGLSAIYIGSLLASSPSIQFSVAMVSAEDVAAGYVIFLLGSLALHIGIQLFHPKKKESSTRVQLLRHPLLWTTVLWMIGLWTKWKPGSIAFLGTIGQLPQMMPFAALCYFVLIDEGMNLPRTVFIVLLSLGVLGVFCANLMSYSKAYIMFSFFPVIWLFILRPSLRRGLPMLLVGLMAFYFILVAPIISHARLEVLEEGETPVQRIISTFESWESMGHSFGAEKFSIPDYMENFLMRGFDALPVGFLVQKVRESGFCLGATMTYATYAFIPRIIWPSKPNVTRGAWFTAYMGFSPSEEEATTSTGMMAAGELYWNFGIAGVLIGMFIIGCMLARLWGLAGMDPRQNLFGMLLYVSLMFSMPGMAEAVTFFFGIIAYFLVFKTVFFALEMLHRSGKRVHGPVTS